ncbi:MAG: hypothetical protein QXJ59_06205 [Thermofilaceae archaeon]
MVRGRGVHSVAGRRVVAEWRAVLDAAGSATVRGSVVFQAMGGWWGEVGLRVGWRVFRRILHELFGVRVGRRVRRVMFYVRNGTVHLDFLVLASREEAELFGLWLARERVVALLLLLFSLAKWYGLPKGYIDALWRAAPRLEVA